MSDSNDDENIIDKIKKSAPPLEDYIDTSGDEWRWRTVTEIQGPHPIHGSTTGENFVINTNTQHWYCYRAGHESWGSIIDYVAMKNGIIECEEAGDIPSNKWVEVFQICCEEFNVENKYGGIDEDKLRELKEKREERNEVYNILTEFSKIAHSRIDHVSWDGKNVREHLKDKRSFSDDIIDELNIGFWDDKVTEELIERYDTEELLRSGLFVVPSNIKKNKNNPAKLSPQSLSKPLEGRIIYPYWKRRKVAYIIGRKTPITEWENGPKYYKLRSGEKYNEVSDVISNDIFYGENHARRKKLLITEGVTDCISLLDAGYDAISPVTTSFREEDKSKLIKLTEGSDEVIIINDNEKSKAGEKGALKTAKVLFDGGRNVKIAFPPRSEDVEKVDVDDYLTEHNNSPKAVKNILKTARSYIDYRIDNLIEGDFKGISEFLEELEGRDYMKIDYALNKLEKKTGITKIVLRRKLRELRIEDPLDSESS